MFWRQTATTQQNHIEQLLDKSDVSLDELLDEDDLIQEAKGLNLRLIDVLRAPKALTKLLEYLINPQPESAGERERLKFPYAACEVFCCEVETITDALLDSEQHMAQLFSLLDADPPLNCLHAGYFTRVVTSLLKTKAEPLMEYLQGHAEVFPALAHHIDTTSIAEVLVRLMGADITTSSTICAPHFPWLPETGLMDALLGTLSSHRPSDAQKNAAGVLASLARTPTSPLATTLASPEFAERVFEQAFASSREALVSVRALDVCIAILEPRTRFSPIQAGPGEGMEHAESGGSQPDSPNEMQASALDAELKARGVAGVIRHMSNLASLLGNPPGSASEQGSPGSPSMASAASYFHEPGAESLHSVQLTPYGALTPPLGFPRLKAVELIAALLQLGDPSVDAPVMEHSLIRTCLDLVHAFPFNNLLHHQVMLLIGYVLDCGSDQLIDHLFQDCHLLDWLLDCPHTVTPTPSPFDFKAATRQPLRAGYLGHMTAIANQQVNTPAPVHTECRPRVMHCRKTSAVAKCWKLSAFVKLSDWVGSGYYFFHQVRGYLGHMTAIANQRLLLFLPTKGVTLESRQLNCKNLIVMQDR